MIEHHQRMHWTSIQSFVGNTCQPHDNVLLNWIQLTITLHCPWEKHELLI